MNTGSHAFSGWTLDAGVLAALVVAVLVHALAFRDRARWGWFSAAVVLVAVALLSPVRLLADGVLFSAHMVQHLILLLIVPALVVLSIPARRTPARESSRRWLPFLGWPAGVGAMWLWHTPALCDAAIAVPAVRAIQTVSLVLLGVLFWWPILARSESQRISPPAGIGYLFTACLACSALGILITLTPLEVCTAFQTPPAVAEPWASLRTRLGALRDRQIGGLLMWVPMCVVYVGAIMVQMGRWFGRAAPTREVTR